MVADTVGITWTRDNKRATIASLSEFTDSNFSEKIMHRAANKNARGDNSQVFLKKDSRSIHQNMKKRKKESLKKTEKRDNVSLKLVPLHINDVLDALKYVKRGSVTSFIQNCNKLQLEYSDAGNIPARHRKFHDYEEVSEIDDNWYKDKESVISDFLEELNIRYVRKCESDVRRHKRMKRRMAVVHRHPKQWSEPKLRNSKLTEKNLTCAQKQKTSIRSDDRSSLTQLTYLPVEQIDNKIKQVKNSRRKIDKHSSRKIDSRYKKKDKRHLDTLDFEKNTFLHEASSRKWRKIHSKSYTAYKEKDIYGYTSKEKKYPDRAREMYGSKSQENTYEIASTKRMGPRKNRGHEHSRRERVAQKGKPKSIQDDSRSPTQKSDEEEEKKIEQTSDTEDVEKGIGKLSPKENQEENKDNVGSGENRVNDDTFEKASVTNEKTLSGKSLIDFLDKNNKQDYAKKNHNAFSDAIYENDFSKEVYKSALADSFQKMMTSDSDIPNKTNTDSENYRAVSRIRANKGKVETNIENNIKISEFASLSKGSEANLIKQNSKIVIRIETSLTKMHSTVSDSQYFFNENTRCSEKAENHQTDSCSLNIVPSDSFNKRYRKNRLNGNFGILSRISVPDFHQKEVLTSKNFRLPKSNKSKLTRNKESDEKVPSNDQLKNIMLTQIVRQNSSMSLQEETKVDKTKKYVLAELSSDSYSHPFLSNICSSSQTPILAPLSDPVSTYATEATTDQQRDSNSSLSDIVATTPRKQSKTKKFESKAVEENNNHDRDTSTESSDDETYYQRSGRSCTVYKKTHCACQNKNQGCQHRDKNTYHVEKYQDESARKLESLNEENTSYLHDYSQNEENNLKTHTTAKKCAVASCHKLAVAGLSQEEINHAHHHSFVSKGNKNDGKKCSKKLDSNASGQKICITCTAPLTDQIIIGPPPDHSPKLFLPENNFHLDNQDEEENIPYFRSPSQEDFQRYISQMRSCFSTQHHPNRSPVMKKYHSLPITTAVQRSPSLKKYYPHNYWELEMNYKHNVPCKGKVYSNRPFDNRDNFVYCCTENTMIDNQQIDYASLQAANLNYEPFPFMQSTGPIMDMNGRPVLILDEEGRPILGYDGEPITPDTYMQEGYQYAPSFQVMNDDSVVQEEISRAKKFSNCFGFH